MKKMLRIAVLLIAAVAIVGLLGCGGAKKEAAQAKDKSTYKVGFVGGIVHPFTSQVERGLSETAKALGVELVTQLPESWEPAVQTPMIDALLGQGGLDLLVVIATDKSALIPVLQRVHDAGIPVVTADTFIGDGIYEPGHPVTFPLSYIGSDNVEGGRIAGEALAKAVNFKGKVYVQSVTAGISTTDQRFQGFEAAIKKFPGMKIVGIDYNDADAAKATAQTTAVLQRVPDLVGIFGTNDHSSIGAGLAVKNAGLQDKVTVIAFDATKAAIENIESGVIDMAVAQKPYEMGYYSMLVGYLYLKGLSYSPKRISTGYEVITRENYKDPQYAKWVY
jgi:ribose transport system substrate-binding protein